MTRMGFEVTLFAPLGRSLVRGSEAGFSSEGPLRDGQGWWKSYGSADLVHVSYALVSLPLLLHPSSRWIPMVYTIHGVPKPEFESEPLFKIGYVLEGLTLRHVTN